MSNFVKCRDIIITAGAIFLFLITTAFSAANQDYNQIAFDVASSIDFSTYTSMPANGAVKASLIEKVEDQLDRDKFKSVEAINDEMKNNLEKIIKTDPDIDNASAKYSFAFLNSSTSFQNHTAKNIFERKVRPSLKTIVYGELKAASSKDTSDDENKDIKKNVEDAKQAAKDKWESKLDQFGFGPAFYVIKYNEEVIADAKDVTFRGDSSISAKGTSYSTSMGVELHYDFSFRRKVKCFNTEEECKNVNNHKLLTAHRLSPFLGLYDLDDGINGVAVGVVYGYIKKVESGNPVTLNTGIGWTVHKDRLVLAKGVSKGAVPPAGLNVADYTEKKDVEGIISTR